MPFFFFESGVSLIVPERASGRDAAQLDSPEGHNHSR
jgi:hypothetical protein